MANSDNGNLLQMTSDATALGFQPDVWPETFDHEGKTWKKHYTIRAGDGDVQCVEYTDGEHWLVVYRD